MGFWKQIFTCNICQQTRRFDCYRWRHMFRGNYIGRSPCQLDDLKNTFSVRWSLFKIL
jgi:hypothetical protein